MIVFQGRVRDLIQKVREREKNMQLGNLIFNLMINHCKNISLGVGGGEELMVIFQKVRHIHRAVWTFLG